MDMTRREIPVDAPAFNPGRSDYPLGGAKTGPIWRAAWALLRELDALATVEHGRPYASAAEMVEGIQQYTPDAHPETVRQILRRAVVAGILESEIRLHAKRNRAHYRIKR